MFKECRLFSLCLVSKGLKSRRFHVSKLSASEFTVSISRVTLRDGGNYLCNQYDDEPTQKIVHLAVLGKNEVSKFLWFIVDQRYTNKDETFSIVMSKCLMSHSGPPKMEATRKGGSFFLKCTAEASHYHPRITWTVDRQSEIPGKLNCISLCISPRGYCRIEFQWVWPSCCSTVNTVASFNGPHVWPEFVLAGNNFVTIAWTF